jgi:ABC-type phosphate/phosphonate transport system substrate-binding protein
VVFALIPQDPFVYRGTLCPPLKEAIAKTFLTLGIDAGRQGLPRERRVGEVREDDGQGLRHHPRSGVK